MRKVGFIGAYDKTDFMLYIAKILTVLGNKVLIIDSSINQKAKYIVPAISPTISYVTEFEDIDVAVGFQDFERMKDYLGLPEDRELNYDIVLLDIDSIVTLQNFGITNQDVNFFVTSFDLYSLKKGLEILSGLREPLNLVKVLFSNTVLTVDDEYLNFLSSTYPVMWSQEKVYFPVTGEDYLVIMENQRAAKIKVKSLSTQYRDSLEFMTEFIVPEENPNNVRKAMKMIEKGV